jgi:hypothetical protein
MSVLNVMLPCACRTWRCRVIYASRVLVVAAGLASGLFTAVKFGLI